MPWVTSTAEVAERTTPPRRARAEARAWVKPVARVGLLSRGIIYVVLAVLAALIAVRGSAPTQASGTGALAEIARHPAGPFLLGLLSAGLGAYGAWRLVQVVTGIEPASRDRPSGWQRLGWSFIAAAYFTLCADAVSLLEGSGNSSSGPSSHPAPYVATALRWPAGQVLVGLGGAGLIIGGVVLAVWSCAHDSRRTFRRSRMPGWAFAGARVTGIIGDVTRGGLILLVGVYLTLGAAQDSPAKAKSVDQVLQTVAHQPLGPLWVSLAAAGLAAFALYSIVEAAYRRV